MHASTVRAVTINLRVEILHAVGVWNLQKTYMHRTYPTHRYKTRIVCCTPVSQCVYLT